MPEIISEIFKVAAGIATPYSLAAFAIAAILYLFLKRRGRVPPLALVIILALVLVPIIVSAYQTVLKDKSIYRLRITVTDPKDIPVEDARVWTSFGGEAKKVAGGWQFDIPAASKPADGKLTVYATKETAFLSGRQEVELGGDPNVAITVKLGKDTSASVRGTVQDAAGHGISGVVVSIAGYPGESAITQSGGSFTLAAHAAIDEDVLLQAEKRGYKPASQWHPAGDEPAVIVLER